MSTKKIQIIGNIATKDDVASLRTDLGELEVAVDGKANQSTTLDGYGITDAYTKTDGESLAERVGDTESAIAILNGTNDGSVHKQISDAIVNANLDQYAQKSTLDELSTVVADKSDVSHDHDSIYDIKGAADTALNSAKSYAESYTNTSISTHNTSVAAHTDIRGLIAELTVKLTNFLDVDDATVDQLSEVITLINNNKGTLESLTTTKINVSDIVNDLTTNSDSKVLSAAQGVVIKTLIDTLQTELDSHTSNKSNPHEVTKAQIGLGNVPNVATNDQTPTYSEATTLDNLTSGEKLSISLGKIMKAIKDFISHKGNTSNPHGVTKAQVGLGNVDNTSDINKPISTAVQNALDGKANDFSIEIYNGTSGNPKPVKFMTVDYSTCGSENGVAIKVSMVSGHGNGSSYAFLQDAIIRVTHTGNVEVDNFKYYGASTGSYDGANRQYGDIFWVIDTTNKVVDFYCLMGQYARVQMTPYKRVTYSTGGAITQYKNCTVYSSGDKVWANNSELATLSDLSNIQVTAESIQAALGYTPADKAVVDELLAITVTVHSGPNNPTADIGEDGDVYLVTEG